MLDFILAIALGYILIYPRDGGYTRPQERALLWIVEWQLLGCVCVCVFFSQQDELIQLEGKIKEVFTKSVGSKDSNITWVHRTPRQSIIQVKNHAGPFYVYSYVCGLLCWLPGVHTVFSPHCPGTSWKQSLCARRHCFYTNCRSVSHAELSLLLQWIFTWKLTTPVPPHLVKYYRFRDHVLSLTLLCAALFKCWQPSKLVYTTCSMPWIVCRVLSYRRLRGYAVMVSCLFHCMCFWTSLCLRTDWDHLPLPPYTSQTTPQCCRYKKVLVCLVSSQCIWILSLFGACCSLQSHWLWGFLVLTACMFSLCSLVPWWRNWKDKATIMWYSVLLSFMCSFHHKIFCLSRFGCRPKRRSADSVPRTSWKPKRRDFRKCEYGERWTGPRQLRRNRCWYSISFSMILLIIRAVGVHAGAS